MAFPITARYPLKFRHSDTGLTPTFPIFKRLDTLANVTAPSVVEIGNGLYYFDFLFSLPTSPDIIFEVDGGASIPTEEIRYISGTISPKDYFLDEPISQVVNDVWDDSTVRAAGSKGLRVDQLGDPTNNESFATVFGKMVLHQKNIRGADNQDLSAMAGAGVFSAGSDSLHALGLSLAQINAETDAASIANAVWDASTTGNTSPGTMGEQVAVSAAGIANNSAIATAVWDKDVSGYVAAAEAGTLIKNTSSLATNIALVKAKTDNLPANTALVLQGIVDSLVRALGLMHENSLLDATSFDGDNNFLAGRLRIYDSKINTEAAAATSPAAGTVGLLGTYNISADYTGGNLVKYTVVKI